MNSKVPQKSVPQTTLVVLLARGNKVWSVLETFEPGSAYRVAQEKMESDACERVSIHEFPGSSIPPIPEISCDGLEDDRTVVFVAQKPAKSGVWSERFYHDFQQRALGLSRDGRTMWTI